MFIILAGQALDGVIIAGMVMDGVMVVGIVLGDIIAIGEIPIGAGMLATGVDFTTLGTVPLITTTPTFIMDITAMEDIMPQIIIEVEEIVII